MTRTARAVLLVAAAALAGRSAIASAQDLTLDEVQRVAPYDKYWELADLPQPAPADKQQRLTAAIEEARQAFAGRGPALARHFLGHIQASPGNSAFFFLFRAVGDAATARLLIASLLEPPPAGMQLGRDPEEVSIAIEAVLQNESVRSDRDVIAALDDVLVRSRERPGGARVAEVSIRLLGKSATPEAMRRLQALASDSNPAIRAAAVEALGRTGSPSAGQTLQRTLGDDRDPRARALSAAALARSQPPLAAASLHRSLQQETNPEVIDAIVSGLATLRALPVEPQACLTMANRCWNPSVAQPLFDCWLATASRDDLIRQAASASWTVRALALRALTQAPTSPINVLRSSPGSAPIIEWSVSRILVASLVEILAQDVSGFPAPNTISHETAQQARDALWELSNRNMTVALEAADQITPISGRYVSAGRFGASHDLASRDPKAYAARRRAWQLLAAGGLAICLAILRAVRPIRKVAAGLLLAVFMWGAWFCFHTDVRELPPPPLMFLTASCLAFLSAGLASGVIGLFRIRASLKVALATIAAAVSGFLLCGVTRMAGWFPIGSDGYALVLEPIGSAVLAAPAALLISLAVVRLKE